MDFTNKTKTSVILCTYNRQEFLPYSIESVLNQSYKNFELIIVNNGSTDETEFICDKYKLQDERIRVITIENNIGASHGRNTGIEVASTEFLTFVDDDDYCEPIMLEKLISLKESYNVDIAICGGWYDFDGRLEPYFIYNELLVLNKVEAIEELLKRERYNVAPGAKLFKKSLFKGISFEEGVLVDDIHTIYKVFSKANTTAACGIPVYRWRKHSKNMTSFIENNRLTPEILEEYLTMHKERIKYLSENVPQITKRVQYAQWSYMISMCKKIKEYNLIDCKLQYQRMIHELKQNYYELINLSFITQREKVLLNEHVEK